MSLQKSPMSSQKSPFPLQKSRAYPPETPYIYGAGVLLSNCKLTQWFCAQDAVCRSVSQCVGVYCNALHVLQKIRYSKPPKTKDLHATKSNYCNTLQHTTTHCNTLQHAALGQRTRKQPHTRRKNTYFLCYTTTKYTFIQCTLFL